MGEVVVAVVVAEESSADLRVNLIKMTEILDNDYNKFPHAVKETFLGCIVDLPQKTPLYGTLLGLVNAKSFDMTQALLKEITDQFQIALDSNKWRDIKLMLRFFAELVNSNVVLPETFLNVARTFTDELGSGGVSLKRSDCIAYVVMSALPNAGAVLSERAPVELDAIVTAIHDYMKARPKVQDLDILRVFKDEQRIGESQDTIGTFWSVLQELGSDGWKVPILMKQYKNFDHELSQALQHELPKFVLPRPSEVAETSYIRPVLSLDITNGKNEMTLSKMERILLHDIIADLIDIMEVNRKECAKYLVGLANNFEPGVFQHPDDDEAMDTEENGERRAISLPLLVVEQILSQMLRLPASCFPQVYYAALAIEVAKTDADIVSPAISKVIRSLYDGFEKTDVECIHRLEVWFAHYLSNFNFEIEKDLFDNALTANERHPHVCFAQDVFAKEIHLSYYERTKTDMPKQYQILIPPEAPAPHFRFREEGNVYQSVARGLVERMTAKMPAEELEETGIKAIRSKCDEEGVQGVEQEKVVQEIFIECVLLLGSKSFSHVLNVIERYLPLLQKLCNDPEMRLNAVKTIASFWRNNTQFLGIVVDKLLNYSVIDPPSVIGWVFDSEQTQNMHRAYPWESLRLVCDKVVGRVEQVKDALADVERRHERFEKLREEGIIQDEEGREEERTKTQELSAELQRVQQDEREIFLIVFQRFVTLLTELIRVYEARGVEPAKEWLYWWTFGWYTAFLRMYHSQVSSMLVQLESVVFPDTLDQTILEPFKQIRQYINQEHLVIS